ncbi:atf-2, partial [Pristionchus pacificus]|uniref:BZIP domain-containing protein n=1 Tax=Pristionchus pacificus TaxID=54126 RepID=A0A8R1UDN1_PRIPA
QMDCPPSSLTRSLSVVVAREDDSMSSEGYSPRSRDDDYGPFYEKRRRTLVEVGTKRRGKEERRCGASSSSSTSNDASLEQRLLALSQENERLKSRLSSRSAMDSLLGGGRLPEMPSMPAASATAAAGGVAALYGGAPTSVITSRYGPTPSSCSTTGAALPMLQLAQLQAAIQQQLQLPSHPILPSTSSSSPLLLSSSSAFQPFSVIKKSPERKVDRPVAPDSSTSDYPTLHSIGRPTDSAPSTVNPPPPPPSSGGLLSAILSAPPLPQPRISPLVPRSSTEHWSGLVSPPRDHHGCSSSSKSDNESATSSSSLSPSGSGGSSQGDGCRSGDPKRQQYMDRRKRNNEAAKRCRANRRAVFEYRSRRVQVLETENDTLRDEIAVLRREIDQYKNRLVERGLTVPATPAPPPTVIARAPASSSPSYSS